VALSLNGKAARRTLSGTVRPWSPDFPLRAPFGVGAERPSGRLTRKDMGAANRPRQAFLRPMLSDAHWPLNIVLWVERPPIELEPLACPVVPCANAALTVSIAVAPKILFRYERL
jgi:hypothetical protein